MSLSKYKLSLAYGRTVIERRRLRGNVWTVMLNCGHRKAHVSVTRGKHPRTAVCDVCRLRGGDAKPLVPMQAEALRALDALDKADKDWVPVKRRHMYRVGQFCTGDTCSRSRTAHALYKRGLVYMARVSYREMPIRRQRLYKINDTGRMLLQMMDAQQQSSAT